MNPQPDSIPSSSGILPHRARLFTPLLLFCLSIAALPIEAATLIWTGGHASSANWNVRDNWGGGGVPTHGDIVVFPSGAARPINTNNIAGLRLHEIQFLGLGGGFNVRGQSLTVSNGISIAADAANTLSVTSITLQGSQTIGVAAGGTLVVNSDLVLSNGSLTLSAEGDMSLRCSISGSGGVTKNGAGQVTYFGEADNSYRGTTVVNEGTLALQQRETISIVPLTVVSRIAVPGNLTVGDGTRTAIVRLNFDDQIANTATVSVVENAELRFYNNRDAISDLIVRGGTVTMNEGMLVLNGDITSLAALVGSTIDGQILLNSDATFDVENGIAAVDLEISANIGSTGGHGFTKAGTGTLRLNGTNTYLGPTMVSNGIIRVGSNKALGTPNGNTTVETGAELIIDSAVETLREPLVIAGTGTTAAGGAIRISSAATIATNIALSAPSTILTTIGGNLAIEGIISGTGPLTKLGPGTLELAGKSPNNFSGGVFVPQGILLLSKTLGASVPGNLIIGTTNSTATARNTRSGNISGAVTLNADCLYDLDGNNESIDALTFVAGGSVETGTGTLTVDSDITLIGMPTAPADNATISGRLWLGSGSTSRIIVHPIGQVASDTAPMFINARIGGVDPIIMEGTGLLTLTESNSFTGPFTIDSGTLAITDDHALGSPVGDTFVEGDGTLRLVNQVHVEDEVLFLNSSATNPPGTSTPHGALVSINSNSWAGTVFLAKNVTVGVYTNSALNLLGPINGFAGLTKVGAGRLIYSGTAINSYIGETRVYEGTLRLARTGGDNRSIIGPLVVGDGLGGTNADIVEVQTAFSQINNMAPVYVASSGRLEIEPHEGIGSLSGSGSVVVMSSLETGHDDTSTVFDGIIDGPGALRKYGTGRFTLNGGNDYTGLTHIMEGVLVVNGFQNDSDVKVEAGATLAGDGVVGSVTADGIVAPGDGIGSLSVENASFQPGSKYRVELNGEEKGNEHDLSYAYGDVNLSGVDLEIDVNDAPFAGQRYLILAKEHSGPIVGTFNGLPEGAEFVHNHVPFRITYEGRNYIGSDSNSVALTVGELPVRLRTTRVQAGNGNGRIDPDECDDLFIALENTSVGAVNIVNAYLKSESSKIVVTQPEGEYGFILGQGVRTNRTAFQIRVTPGIFCGVNAQLALVLETAAHGRFSIPVVLPTGSPAEFVTLPSIEGIRVIPAFGTLESSIAVTNSFWVGKVAVSIHATHPSVGDLRFRLRSPYGTEVLLASNRGGNGNSFGTSCDLQTTFDDDAADSITTAAAPFVGTFTPEGTLSDFEGLYASGITSNKWTLLVEDTVPGGLGALQCWSLHLAPAECTDGGGGCGSCQPTIVSALNESSPTMTHRIWLHGGPSGCGDTPGRINLLSGEFAPYRYNTHTFTNSGPDACVSVVFTVPPCGVYLSATAYLNDFNPDNLREGFLGGAGYAATYGTSGFGFSVPAGARFTVVVNEINADAPFESCGAYSLELYGLPCPEELPTLHIANDAGPDDVRLHWSTAYPGFQLQGMPSLGDGIATPAFTNVVATPTVIDGQYSVTNRHNQTGNGFFRLRKP